MIKNAVLEELGEVQQLLDECLMKMDDITSPKAKNLLWRLFFPAGQFIEQKSSAKAAAAILANIDTRLREMVEVLEERQHLLLPSIHRLVDSSLIDIGEQLVELPERAQYMVSQVENLKLKIKETIEEIKQYPES